MTQGCIDNLWKKRFTEFDKGVINGLIYFLKGVRKTMKGNIFEYKGYHTKLEVDTTSCKVRGKIEGINDFVDFESHDVKSAERAFHEAVDDYLEFCAEVGKIGLSHE